MRHLWFCLLIPVILTFLIATNLSAEKISTARVTIKSKADLLKLQDLHLDDVYRGADFVDVLVSPDQMQTLAASGLSYQVTIDDMTSFFRSRFDQTRDMGGYRTLSEIELVMDSIVTQNPSIVLPKFSIGTTINGRNLWVFKVSDNPFVDEPEPEIYYFAAIHAREVITPELLIYFVRYLTNNYGTDPQATFLVNNREMFFTFCLNPDGYYYNQETDPGGGGLWRKNRRNNGGGSFGVDLNRNYGYQWGYDDDGSSPFPDDETYRGTGPFSEPETQAARDFITSRNFVITVSYHSYSNLFLYPWGYDEIVTPDNEIFAQMGDSATAFNGYSPGPAWALYLTNGTTDDWGYGEQSAKDKNYAVSIEVGSQSDNFWPPTNRIAPLVQENLQPNLFYARVAGNPRQLLPPHAPTIYAIGNVDTSYFNLYWRHLDIDNPAVSYQIWQLQGQARITDDLEAGGGYWTENGFSLSTTRAHSGAKSYWGGSTDGSDYKVTTQDNIQVGAGDSLRIWTWYDIENGWDYGYVEVSTNGGASWSSIPGSITTNSDPHGNNYGNGITGSSGGWVLAKFNLGSYVGTDIMVRFRFVTDPFVANAGWYIDDISPLDVFTQKAIIADNVTDTSLFVNDLAVGDYYYQLRARDAQNQLSAKSETELAHVSYFTGCNWLVGDANNSGLINIADVIYLLAYIFRGGPAPIPGALGSGDADCSQILNISDAVYLIGYIFNSGPGPACSCSSY